MDSTEHVFDPPGAKPRTGTFEHLFSKLTTAGGGTGLKPVTPGLVELRLVAHQP